MFTFLWRTSDLVYWFVVHTGLSLVVCFLVYQCRVVLVLSWDEVSHLLVGSAGVLLNSIEHLAWDNLETWIFGIWTFATQIVVIVVWCILWRLTTDFHSLWLFLLSIFSVRFEHLLQVSLRWLILVVALMGNWEITPDWGHKLAVSHVRFVLGFVGGLQATTTDLTILVWI